MLVVGDPDQQLGRPVLALLLQVSLVALFVGRYVKAPLAVGFPIMDSGKMLLHIRYLCQLELKTGSVVARVMLPVGACEPSSLILTALGPEWYSFARWLRVLVILITGPFLSGAWSLRCLV